MKKGKKGYQSFSNWLVVLACIILIPILAVNLFIIFQSKTNKDKVPSILGYKPFIVLSGSMEGKIHKGDLIITKKVDPKTLKLNDIIAFRDAENTVTTHRIIDIVVNNGETHFITKGDNNSTQDRNLVSLSDVEGIYVARISGIGSMMSSLSEPTTILMLVLIITIIFVIGFVISSKREKELEKKEFLEYKLMKEQQEKEKEELEREELLKLRQLKKQQEQQEELLRLKQLKEQQERDYGHQELEKLRQLKIQEQEEDDFDRQTLLKLRQLKEQQEDYYGRREKVRNRDSRESYDSYDSYNQQDEVEQQKLLRIKQLKEQREKELERQRLLELLLQDEENRRNNNSKTRYRDDDY